MGSANHEYRKACDGLFVHLQHFMVRESYLYRVNRRDQLTMQFTRRGAFRMNVDRGTHRFRAGTVRITGFPVSETHVPATGSEIVGVSLIVDRARLIERYGLQVDRVPAHFRALFTSPIGLPQPLELPLGPASWLAVEDMASCAFPEPMRGVYLCAKAEELICFVVMALNAMRPCDTAIAVSRDALEAQAIEAAAAIYRREIGAPPSVDAMARRVGLNRNALSAGFRGMFGETPAEYARRFRLAWAKDRLEGGGLNVAEIAAASGYASPAAFSRSFSEAFGRPPSAFQPGHDAAAA